MKKTTVKLLMTMMLLVGMPIKQTYAAPNYNRLVPTPPRSSINQRLTSPGAAYMTSVLGRPGALTENCSSVTNDRVRRLMATEDVGPFRATGLKPALESLRSIFAKVRRDKPALYAQLESAGMLCVRKVRGGTNFSNHSWGSAIDIKINGRLDRVGDRKTQVGLKELYPYFHQESFYWGAGYSGGREDSMHFEVSKEKIQEWRRAGKL